MNLRVAVSGYLVLSVLLWWNVWSSHPTSSATCGCGDSSLFTWFLAWPPYALVHGLDPLYSSALFHPGGVNLLSNTAVVAIGLVLAPVTWLFGPIATLNVAVTLSTFLSATAMFVVARRWVSWAPAAFAAGLLYGFSPFILIGLTDGHLMLGMAPVPPLVVLCFDEMLIRQRRRPVVLGVGLGLLVAVQYFIGTEALVIVTIAGLVGVTLVVLYGLRHRFGLRQRARYAVTSLGAAAVTAGALLAYPVWFTLAGPAHLAGPVWGTKVPLSFGGPSLSSYVDPTSPSGAVTRLTHEFGGYQAPTLSGQYLGIGLVAVLAVGLVAWRKDRRLWLFGAVGAVSVVFSFGLEPGRWTPWRLVVRLPLLENVIPSRFLIVTYLCAAAMLAITIDHTHDGVVRWSTARARSGAPDPSLSGHRRDPWARSTASAASAASAALAGLAVAALALAPIISYFADGLPITATPVVVPTWFRIVAPHLPGRQVLLVFPVPFALKQSAMTWQAVDGMHYDMVGGGGPGSLPERAGRERAGQAAIANISVSQSPGPVTAAQIRVVRQALDGWGVTTIVVPDQRSLPGYERVHLVRSVTVLMTAATGRAPVHQDGAWVWTRVDRSGPPAIPSADRLAACVAGSQAAGPASITGSVSCVLDATGAAG